ncbi:hypothetical protein BU26DRAFT_567655 [Trematosphaeria pertusa]|uniref:Heterokaryon incompatibility domain-containing protein n=1 Tax=Trematosphaeria pertusa TaxID=390896 RepID=A0A6A6I7V1_9PLEO|nr:uncharacterized protein BU26DRAFT_567655 [Trematosphaeria pertusa]KAF2246158.1 hypothetical protein BU26DRAFT_567655 [Trematosphaeria pertusa]
MSDLGKRAWWTRIWCIQELANAQVATFKCGKDEVDYVPYWAVSLYIQLFNSRALLDHPNADLVGMQKMLWLTNMLSDAFPSTLLGIRRVALVKGGHNVKRLLYKCNVVDANPTRIGATDPRDRVFALLGIANDEAAKAIVPNYALSCEEAYIMAARVLLMHGHDDILSLCRAREVCKNLPSWVPDWSAMNRKPWSIWDEDKLFNASNLPDGRNSSCLLNTSGEAIFSREITLDVVFVDTVQEVGHH